MRIITAHNILNFFFFFLGGGGGVVFSYADILFLEKKCSPKALNLIQNGNFSILSLFCLQFFLP